MDYKRIYDQIICNAKQLGEVRRVEKKQKLNYFEKHHIIPKCMNGSNNADNLVLLTAKEHYMAHRLLCEIYPGSAKMIKSLMLMMRNLPGQYRYKVSSKIYNQIKETHSKLMSDIQRGSNNIFYGKKHTIESIERIRTNVAGANNHMFGKHRTELEKNKIRISMSKWPELICPYCDKRSKSKGNMEKYHFENCRHKPGNELIVWTKKLLCPYCGIAVHPAMASRWHFEKCKHKNNDRY